MIGRGDERHFAYADLLRGHEHLTHELVPNVGIAANVHFRLRILRAMPRSFCFSSSWPDNTLVFQ